MIDHETRINPFKATLARKEQRAWKIAAVAMPAGTVKKGKPGIS